jgi:hypothetical protein
MQEDNIVINQRNFTSSNHPFPTKLAYQTSSVVSWKDFYIASVYYNRRTAIFGRFDCDCVGLPSFLLTDLLFSIATTLLIAEIHHHGRKHQEIYDFDAFLLVSYKRCSK